MWGFLYRRNNQQEHYFLLICPSLTDIFLQTTVFDCVTKRRVSDGKPTSRPTISVRHYSLRGPRPCKQSQCVRKRVHVFLHASLARRRRDTPCGWENLSEECGRDGPKEAVVRLGRLLSDIVRQIIQPIYRRKDEWTYDSKLTSPSDGSKEWV